MKSIPLTNITQFYHIVKPTIYWYSYVADSACTRTAVYRGLRACMIIWKYANSWLLRSPSRLVLGLIASSSYRSILYNRSELIEGLTAGIARCFEDGLATLFLCSYSTTRLCSSCRHAREQVQRYVLHTITRVPRPNLCASCYYYQNDRLSARARTLIGLECNESIGGLHKRTILHEVLPKLIYTVATN